jgi:Spy/CpxP family protein refolding chaperone
MKKIVLFTLICCLSLSGLGFAMNHHSKESMPPGGKWWHIPEMSKKLNLTSEEQEKLDELYVKNREKLIELKSDVEKKMLAMEQIIENENFNESVCIEQFKKLQDTRTKLAIERFRFLVEVRKLLGFERFQQLKIGFDKHRMKMGE